MLYFQTFRSTKKQNTCQIIKIKAKNDPTPTSLWKHCRKKVENFLHCWHWITSISGMIFFPLPHKYVYLFVINQPVRVGTICVMGNRVQDVSAK